MKELLERVSYRNNTLTLWDDGCVTQIRPRGRDGLRVTITPEGGKKTSDWALDIPLETDGIYSEEGNTVTLRNGKIGYVIRYLYPIWSHGVLPPSGIG